MMVMIDDATNWTHAKFFESETTAAAMTVFGEYVGHYGLHRSLYVDRARIYETHAIPRSKRRCRTPHRTRSLVVRCGSWGSS